MWSDLARSAVFKQTSFTPTGREKKGGAVGEPGELFKEQENLERVRQVILDWVTFEKRWDEHD